MCETPGRVTVSEAMADRRSKGATMGTTKKIDPDPPDDVAKPSVPPDPEAEAAKPFEFVERPRKAPDIYISRPELGRERDRKR
jgi:hypothetical protein